jgi:arginine:agmatine antiporter
MVISASFATILVLVQALGSEGFAAVYRLMVGLSTMAAVVPYAFCSLARILIAGATDGRMPRVSVIEVIAFVFAIFTLYGSGAEPVLYGLVLLMLGIPVYVWQRRNAAGATDKEAGSSAATRPAVSG